jgi:hypothetical protein
MKLPGHSQMRTTMDIYSHVMPARAREVADRAELRGLEPLTPTLPGRVDRVRGRSPKSTAGV